MMNMDEMMMASGGGGLEPEKVPFPSGNEQLDRLLAYYFELKKEYDRQRQGSLFREYLFVDPEEDPEYQRRLEAFQELGDELMRVRSLISDMAHMSGFPFVSPEPTFPVATPGVKNIEYLMSPRMVKSVNTPPTDDEIVELRQSWGR